MKCENCGANLKADQKTRFCPYCGTIFEIAESGKFKSNQEIDLRFLDYQVKETKAKSERRLYIIAAVSLLVLFLITAAINLVPNWSEDTRINRLSDRVQQLIIEGDYEAAAIEVESIRVEKQGLFDGRYNKYETLRNDLKKLIEKKKRESGK